MSSQYTDSNPTLSTGVDVAFSASRINTRAILCQADINNAANVTIKNVASGNTIRILAPGESLTLIPDTESLIQGHQLNVADYSARGTTSDHLYVGYESNSVGG